MTWTTVKGWETVGEQGLLSVLASNVPEYGTIVEIGSEFGMSASLFLRYAPQETDLHCVEINPNAPFMDSLEKEGFDLSRVTWHNESSHTLHWGNGFSIDLLFVDGDHSLEGAKKDLQIWSKRMASNGVIAVHDCACSTNKTPHPDHYAVMSAVQQWLQEEGSAQGWRIAFSVDTTVVLMQVNQ